MLKWLLKSLLALVVISLVILGFLPTILSSNWGKQQLISYLSVSSKSSVKIKSIELGWFKKQQASDISISSPDLQLHIGSISSEKGLFSFVMNGFAFDEVSVVAPKCTIGQINRKKGSQGGAGALFIKHLILKEGECIIANGEEKIQFDHLNLDLNLNRKEKKVDIDLNTRTSYNNKGGKIDLRASYQHESMFPIFSAQAQCEDLPLLGLDQVFQLLNIYDKPLLSRSFGESADIHLNLDSKTNLLEAIVNTRYLSLNLDTQKKDSPLIFDWSVNPDLLHLFNIPISQPFSISATIQSLALPSLQDFIEASIKMRLVISNLKYSLFDFERVELNLDSDNLKEQFHLVSNMRFDSPHLRGDFSLDGIIQQFKKIDLTANSEHLLFLEPLTQIERHVNHLSMSAKENRLEGEITLDDLGQPTLLGNQFNAKFNSNYTLHAFDGFNLVANSDSLKGNFVGTFDFADHRLRLSKDGYVDYKLNPLVFKKATEKLPFPLHLKDTTLVTFILEKSSSIDIVRAKLVSEDFTIALDKPQQEYEFQNIDSQIEYTRAKQLLSAKAALNVKKEGKIKVEMEQTFGKDDFTMSLDADNLPTNLFSPWFELDAPLASLIGPQLSLTATLNSELDFSIKSDLLQLKGGIRRDEVTSPISGNLTITPESYKALNGKDANAFVLTQPAAANIKISRFKIDPKVGFDSSEFKGQFVLSDFSAKKKQLEAQINTLQLNIKKKKNEKASATLSSTITSKKKQSKIDGSMVITSVDTSLPLYPMLASMRVDSSLSINKLPTFVLEALSQPFGEFPIAIFLGNQLNAELDIDMGKERKKVLIDIDSTQADLHVEGIIAKRRFLLTKDVIASFKLSEKLSHFMFDNIGFAITPSSTPINLNVSEKGFILPLQKHPLNTTTVRSMVLNLGRMTAINSGTLSGVNSIFKLGNKNTIPLWFAPYFMSMQNGKLTIERTEILLDGRYHICMWGVIDYIRKYVDITVGLTAQSLKATLGIDGLPPAYVLKVPLKGPFGNVKLQTGAVAAKLALLVGGRSAAPNTIFGGVVNIMNQVMNDQSDVPKPKRPYPWENQAALQVEPIELKFGEAKEKELVAPPPTSIQKYLTSENPSPG